MTAPLPLALYLAAVAVPVPLMLRRARWVVRAPRIAIAVWFGMITSSLGGTVLLGCEMTEGVFGSGPWECCREFLNAAVSTRPEVAAAGVAVLLTFGLPTWVLAVLLRDVLRLRRRQLRLAEALDVLGRPVRAFGGGVLVIDHECPAAYCVAARGGRVIVTAAALRALPRAELSAVVAHERAHLEGCHYLLTTAAASFGRALPGIPLFTSAGPAVARLAEMAADDAAARGVRGEVVARGLALLVQAGARHRNALGASVLQVSADHVAERINRLLDTRLRTEERRSIARGASCLAGLVIAPALVITATAGFWC